MWANVSIYSTLCVLQGGSGHLTVNYTDSQSFLTTLSYTLGYKIVIVLFQTNSVKTFQPIILIYRKGNLSIIIEGGCMPTYRQLSYPLKSLVLCVFVEANLKFNENSYNNTYLCQGSKGIGQWSINWCTSKWYRKLPLV